MLDERVFRSEDLPPAERFDAWRDCLARSHVPLELSSEHAAGYLARLRHIPLGETAVWPAAFQPLELRRTPRLIRERDPEVFHLSLLLRGEARASWGRHEVAYGPFDFHVSDSGRPYEVVTGRGTTACIGVEIPKALLPLPRVRAERAVGRRTSGREGVGALLAQFLTRLADDNATYQAYDAPRLGMVLTDLVTVLFARCTEEAVHVPPETHARTLTLRVKAFIGRHLQDPGLTPARIADAHHISCSYLHRLFRDESDTVAAYVRRRRLEGAHRDLADPALRATPIHVIAARWGYPRAADFTRAFRAVHGVSPSDHRAAARHPREAAAR